MRLAAIRPDLEVKIVQDDKPFFRFGNGKWGQALFRVELRTGGSSFHVYSLPAQNVPVLVGMRELDQLDVILNCKTRHAIVSGKQCILQATSKVHALLDFAVDIPFSHGGKQSQAFRVGECHFSPCEYSVSNEQSCIHFDNSSGPDFSIFAVEQQPDAQSHVEFLGISESQWQFLRLLWLKFPQQPQHAN